MHTLRALWEISGSAVAFLVDSGLCCQTAQGYNNNDNNISSKQQLLYYIPPITLSYASVTKMGVDWEYLQGVTGTAEEWGEAEVEDLYQ
ncbi:hypothetical protein SK128_006299, partial [Halocaridina rubra]